MGLLIAKESAREVWVVRGTAKTNEDTETDGQVLPTEAVETSAIVARSEMSTEERASVHHPSPGDEI